MLQRRRLQLRELGESFKPYHSVSSVYNRMKTAVIILNWNTKELLSSFIPSLLADLEGEDAQLIVVDNGSSDGSPELMAASFPEVRTIVLDRNYGFTGGYDRAVSILLGEAARPEYIVLMNTDIATEPGWLGPLVRHLDAHPECGVCGPKLLALKREGTDFMKTSDFEYAGAAGGYIDRYGFPFCRGRVMSMTERDSGQYDGKADVFWISGACLATRTALWESLGGLDDRFFAHMEEIDYCWRAALAGYKVSVIPESRVWHLGGGTLSQNSPFKLKLNFRNSLLMLEKNLPATIGERLSRRRLLTRKMIDTLAAIAYLFSGKFSAFNAVVQAHREYRKLRGLAGHEGSGGIETCRRDLREGSDTGGPVGMFPFSIIWKSIRYGKGSFKYLREYENNH